MQDMANSSIQSPRADEMRRVMDEYATQNNSAQTLYTQAQHRVKAKLGFYSHLTAYVMVNALLITIWFVTSLSVGSFMYPWFIWPLFGWGIGVVSQFFAVFGNTRTMEHRMLANEMQKLGASEPYTTGMDSYKRHRHYRR